MKTALLVLVFAASTGWSAAEWQNDLTPPSPGTFPPLRPLTASYQFGWGAIKAAEAEFEFSKTKNGKLRLELTSRSTGLARTLWRMDSKAVSICDPVTLQPISLRQTESYKDEKITTKLDFGIEGLTRLRTSNKKRSDPEKPKRFKLQHVHDLHSALLFVRSQPLTPGDSYQFVVYPSTSAYLAQVDVVGPQPVKLGKKQHPSVKLDLKLRRISKRMELEPHQKFKRASAWLSDDQDRLILKIQADIAVGSVWTELQKVEFAP